MTKFGSISLILIIAFGLGCGSKKAVVSGLSYEKRKIFEQQFFEANKQKALNNKEKALTLFQQSLETYPSSSAVMFELAKLHYQLDNYNEALYWSKKAVENAKEYNHWYSGQLAQFYNKFGKYKESAEVFVSMIKEEPEQKDNYTEAANQFYNAREFDKAIDQLLIMQNKFGVEIESAHRLEFIYSNSGQKDKANEAMQKLCDKYPENIEYKGYLAESYLKADRPVEAIAVLNEIINLDSNDGFAYFMLYNIYKRQGNSTLAYKNLKKTFESNEIDLVEKLQAVGIYFLKINTDEKAKSEIIVLSDILLEQYPNSIEPLVLKSDISNALNDFEMARSYLIQALAIDKGDFKLWIKLLKLDEMLKNAELQLADANSAIALYPNISELYKTKAYALYHLNQYHEAIAASDEGLEVAIDKQDKIALLMCKALSNNKLNNVAMSEGLYKDVLKLDPYNAGALNNYAYNLALRGERLVDADSMINVALKIEGANPILFDTKAWILYHQQKYSEAISWLNKAIELDPKNIEYYVHSKAVYQKLGNQTLANDMQQIIDKLISEKSN